MINPKHEQFNKDYLKLTEKHGVILKASVLSFGKNWWGKLGIKLFGRWIILKPKIFIQDKKQ